MSDPLAELLLGSPTTQKMMAGMVCASNECGILSPNARYCPRHQCEKNGCQSERFACDDLTTNYCAKHACMVCGSISRKDYSPCANH